MTSTATDPRRLLRLLSILLPAILLLVSIQARAQENKYDPYVVVRIFDVGNGLMCGIRIPNNHYMIYDAGGDHSATKTSMERLHEFIPEKSTIDLFIISHNHADHTSMVGEVLDSYTIRKILWNGQQRQNRNEERVQEAVLDEAKEGCLVLNLNENKNIGPGTTFKIGPCYATVISEFNEQSAEWDLPESDLYNASSIVIRLRFGESSIFFSGDIVGRYRGDTTGTSIGNERFIVHNSPVIKTQSDVIIAPHHGSDGSSSISFIEAVKPDYVVFSSAPHYRLPREETIQRYLDSDVYEENIFRTDRHNEKDKEALKPPKKKTTSPEPSKHNDIEITMSEGGVEVSYVQP
ncbi:MAG TPA: MBL fold metallo-hydrolase [Candidatus Hydrogenedentes bacterium]|nr:MBL fold metallo-hydrolase [Candidatus Hydrogenedentota bacterium]